MSMRIVLLVVLASPAFGLEYPGAGAGRAAVPCAPDFEPCDDGNPCTQQDVCSGGVCLGGDPKICTALDQCHIPGTCDPATGACSNPPKPNGSACDDGDGCTQTDTCEAGVCTGADPVVCSDDAFSCTEVRCRDGLCEQVAIDDRCPGDACATPVCLPSSPLAEAGTGCIRTRPTPNIPPVTCDEDRDPCTDDYCVDGVCAHQDVPDRQRCDPVSDAYDRTLGLLDGSAALAVAAAASWTDAGSSAARVQLEERLAAFAGDLEAIERTLAGRAPADVPGKTVADRRARAVLPLASGLRAQLGPALRSLARARRAGELSREQAHELSREVRNLLSGSRALRRNLRQVRRISRIFTP